MSKIKYYTTITRGNSYIRFVMPPEIIQAYKFEHKDKFAIQKEFHTKLSIRYNPKGEYKLSKSGDKHLLIVNTKIFNDDMVKNIKENSAKHVPFIIQGGAMVIDMTSVATVEKGFHIQPKGFDLLGMVANG